MIYAQLDGIPLWIGKKRKLLSTSFHISIINIKKKNIVSKYNVIQNKICMSSKIPIYYISMSISTCSFLLKIIHLYVFFFKGHTAMIRNHSSKTNCWSDVLYIL